MVIEETINCALEILQPAPLARGGVEISHTARSYAVQCAVHHCPSIAPRFLLSVDIAESALCNERSSVESGITTDVIELN